MKKYVSLRDMPFWIRGVSRETTRQGFIRLDTPDRFIYDREIEFLVKDGWIEEVKELTCTWGMGEDSNELIFKVKNYPAHHQELVDKVFNAVFDKHYTEKDMVAFGTKVWFACCDYNDFIKARKDGQITSLLKDFKFNKENNK